jgi:CrcB protein
MPSPPSPPSSPTPHPAHGRRHPIWEHPDAHLPIDPDLAPDDPGEPRRDHHRGPHLHRARRRDVVLSIAVGGSLGTLGRYGASLLWPADGASFPWGTFAVNASGSLVLGFLLTALLERGRAGSRWRTLLCVGFLGSWTTMSSLAVESDVLLRHGHVVAAAADVLATVVVGLVLSWVGIVSARSLYAGEPQWSSSSS